MYSFIVMRIRKNEKLDTTNASIVYPTQLVFAQVLNPHFQSCEAVKIQESKTKNETVCLRRVLFSRLLLIALVK